MENRCVVNYKKIREECIGWVLSQETSCACLAWGDRNLADTTRHREHLKQRVHIDGVEQEGHQNEEDVVGWGSYQEWVQR